MSDFDVIRNQTLMFFLDHLMGKGQSRTLHDLSCQFGAKGFTKEMRQIAGGSQAGLKKFLLQFPSLFTIDGENVYLTPLTSDKNGSSLRDYTKETIKFFTEKLMSYGIAEVPLKSLFGHRSQASSEIRHVSGQNVREFCEFLKAHSNVFVVRDDYVVLQSVLDQLEQEGHNESLRRMPEEITHDPYLMQQLVNELEDKVYNLTENYSNKISISLLYNAMQSKEQLPALWNDFVKVPTDLITFLHINSRIFLVQGNMVSLTNERLASLREKKTNVESDYHYHKSSQFTPEKKSTSSDTVKDVQQQKTTSVNSYNSRNSSATIFSTMTVNQRIRSQIIKIVSQGCTKNTNSVDNNRNTSTIGDSTENFNDNQYESIDLQTIKPRTIVKSKDCELIVKDIMQNCSAIAFDIEGINMGAKSEVTLIQISYQKMITTKESSAMNRNNNNNRNSPSNHHVQVVLFDVFLNPALIQNGLKLLLESEKIVKVGHDVRTNSASLYKCFGITLKNVFDTQVAHLIVQQQSTGRPAYKPTKYISFYTLCSIYGGLNLNPKMKDRLNKHYRKDCEYWKNRPLNEEMIQFAITEVYAIYPSVYQKIRSMIRPEYEPLFEQLVYESVFAHIYVDQIKQLKRQRKFELELTNLKLRLFNNDKKKIVLSNREIRLLRYIDLTEEIRNKIEGPLNVAKKLKLFENKKLNGSNNNEHQRDSPNKNGDSSGDETDESDVGYVDDRIIEDDYEKQSSSLSLSSREYDHSGEYFSSYFVETCCQCHCHNFSPKKLSIAKLTNRQSIDNEKHIGPLVQDESNHQQRITTKTNKQGHIVQLCDTSTQTLSTGDIVITKIYFNESNQLNNNQYNHT